MAELKSVEANVSSLTTAESRQLRRPNHVRVNYKDNRAFNVVLTLVFISVSTLFSAVAQGSIFDSYLYLLNNSNQWVGYAQSVSGVCSLVVAIPVVSLSVSCFLVFCAW